MTNLNITAKDNVYLQKAVDLAVRSVHNNGGPFGAVLVGKSSAGILAVFTDNNHVTENNDPTAHAEVSVIRKACSELRTFDLTGYTLYSSCEPCPMCLSASLWTGVDRVIFAADRFDAADAGFNDLAFYEMLNISLQGENKKFCTQLPGFEGRTAPFEAWKNKSDRIDY